jgi:hypothetical protein
VLQLVAALVALGKLADRTAADIAVVGGLQPAETASKLLAATTCWSMFGAGTLVMRFRQPHRTVRDRGAICFHSLETAASSCLSAGCHRLSPAKMDMAMQP